MAKEKSEKELRSKKRKKYRAVDLLGGKCCICGYNKCVDALDFHHIEKKNGSETISSKIYRLSFSKVIDELKKCILVCANCHREIHSIGVNVDYQIHFKKWISKICPYCNRSFETGTDNVTYCSKICYDLAQRRVVRPSKETLEKLLNDGETWANIGRVFGVSDTAVRKWARKYKIIT